MFQDGSVSTRQQTDVRDFGIAPSYKFGIGTPTEVTFYGLLQYNHDHVDYGLPALNRYPANVSPNLAYGFPSDRTDQFISMGRRSIHAMVPAAHVNLSAELLKLLSRAKDRPPCHRRSG